MTLTMELIVTAAVALVVGASGGWAVAQRLAFRQRRNRSSTAALDELRECIERAPIPMVMSHRDGTIHFVNRSYVEAFGWSAAELKDFANGIRLMHPDPKKAAVELARFGAAVAAAGEDGQVGPLSDTVTARDGFSRAIVASGVVLGDRLMMFLQDLTAINRVEQQLQHEAALHQAVITNAAEGVCVNQFIQAPPGTRFSVWNRRLEEITGFDLETINARGWLECLYPDPKTRSQAQDRNDRLRAGEGMDSEDRTITHRDGSKRIITISTSSFEGAGGTHTIALVRDVTQQRSRDEERRNIEIQVQHAQKLESLGVLAGGIAHDFNNILMSVLGRASLLGSQIGLGNDAQPHLREIENAAHRAAELCRQMLAYAGKGRFIVEPMDLRSVVDEMGRMLEVSIAKKVVLKYDFAEGLPSVNADASQLRQVVMNLITNASEAIGDRSGVITIRTAVMECDREYLRETYLDDDLPEGLYVYLEVADTGCGMDLETKQRMFEPFFTTKFTGRGLGMAAVLGIIRGHRGALKVYSEIKRGTTIKVLFPAISARAERAIRNIASEDRALPEGLTVLVVDDEETIRALAKDMLTALGVSVLLAADGREAVRVFERESARISCVILDLTMPHMDGDEAFRELRRLNRDVRVIMSSGYNQQEVTQRFAGKGLVGFLQKPYNLPALVGALRSALAERPQ